MNCEIYIYITLKLYLRYIVQTNLYSSQKVVSYSKPSLYAVTDITCIHLLCSYGNQYLVDYKLTCPPGNVAFFDLTSIDMEDANCMDPNFNEPRYYCYHAIVYTFTIYSMVSSF